MVYFEPFFSFGAYMFDLCHDSFCYYCKQPAFLRALIVNKFDTISYEFVCDKCIVSHNIEIGFQTHSGD